MEKQLNRKVPAIRFKGFDNDWDKQKIETVVQVCSGRDYKHLANGNIPVYGTGGYMLSVDAALSYDQDAIGIGRKGTIDKPYVLRSPFWTVDTLFYVIPKINYDLYFLFKVFQCIDWKGKDESTGVPSLSKVSINEVCTLFPKIEEQMEVGSYFKVLDQNLTLYQHKHDKLITLKQAMLQKMFPKDGALTPEVRFKGFEGSWEERKISDICGVTSGGGTPKTSEANFWSGNIPWIQSSDISDANIYSVTPRKWINQEAIRKSATKLVSANSIAVVTRVGVGKLALVEFDYATSQDFLSLSKLNVDKHFAVAAVHLVLKSKMNETQGTSIKGLTKEELLDYRFLVPEDKSEQQKIGNYFQKLDQLIDQHTTQLEKLKQIKAACLARMFV
ncbi:restriction endonuclease subunit S [Oceanimonas sp. AH20CE76]|uniref:restriction endonuclease subunit S n=1 Tax=Oceanimonas sp. AH20CE76 TaxID=2977120 RepID=UPI0031FE8708